MNGFPTAIGPSFELDGHAFPGAYGPQEQEYETLTKGCALLDFSALDWLAVTGPDAVSFLQGLVTQDVSQLGTGKPALILNSSGKLITTLYLYNHGGQILIETPAGSGESIHTHLDRYLIMEEASLEVRADLSCLSLQGPLAGECLNRLGPLPPETIKLSRDRSGHGGFDLICNTATRTELITRLIETGAQPVGINALNVARIEAFIPWFAHDMQAGLNPLIFGLSEYINHHKGCYIGQETVAMTRDRGRPPQIMVLLESAGTHVPVIGTALLVEGRAAGEIRSASHSPVHRSVLAIAILKYSFAKRMENNLCDPEGRTWTILKSTLIAKQA